MELEIINHEFSICKLRDASALDYSKDFTFLSKTDEEMSLVCPSETAPAETLTRDDGWRAFRIRGVLDFSLIGVLSKISGLLAENKIGIFAVSTYNTDYIFTKADQFPHALAVLKAAGYRITDS